MILTSLLNSFICVHHRVNRFAAIIARMEPAGKPPGAIHDANEPFSPSRLNKNGACAMIFSRKETMVQDRSYPEKRDIRAIVILLATQGMIHLGEIPDPVRKTTSVNLEGARFFIDLLAELKRKTQGNVQPDESIFIQDTLQSLEQVLSKRSGAGHG
jgi:hypothetical protein